jgi:hypothetical protein
MANYIYVMQIRDGGSAHLHEMTEAAFKKLPLTQGERWERVPGHMAHAYIRRGGVHSTSLWIDDQGKVRRAG